MAMNLKIGGCIILSILLIYCLQLPFLEEIDLKFLDAKFWMRGAIAPGDDIVLVEIDKKSIARLGRWPWRRSQVAKLIDQISEGDPKVVALDLFFPDPSPDPNEDRVLAESFKKAGNVILPYYFFRAGEETGHLTGDDIRRGLENISKSRFAVVSDLPPGAKLPSAIKAYGVEANIPTLAEATRGSGFCNVYLERAGTIRRLPLVLQAWDHFYYSLSLAACRAYLGGPAAVLIVNGERIEQVKLGSRIIPTDSEGRMFINYCADEKMFRRCSSLDILEGRVPPGTFARKMVLVGGTSMGDFETRPTPISPALYSITIQANAIDNILRQRYLREGFIAICVTIASIVLPGLLLSVGLPRTPASRRRAVFAGGSLVAFGFFNYLIFSSLAIQASTMYPALSILLVYAAISVWLGAGQERGILRLRRGIAGIAKAGDATLDIERLFPGILDEVIDFINADAGMLLLYSCGSKGGERPALEMKAARNMSGIHIGHKRFLPISRLISKTERGGNVLIVPHPFHDGRFKFAESAPDSHELAFCVCIPLSGRGKKLGAIYAERRSVKPPMTPHDLEILDSFARQAAVAVENAQLYCMVRALEQRLREEEENVCRAAPAPGVRASHGIIGATPSMHEIFSLIDKVKNSTTTVLIKGETGTGKELAARAIHFAGNRSTGPFVAQNCSALPEQLLESELFGHVKGAFTGAVAHKKGLFEIASGGTVFLDEVGDMTPSMQTKLLRVLQERVVRPVGGSREIKVDVRIISATNRDLEKEVKEGRFREDLYYRLNVFPLILPPLRERSSDIPTLAHHFLEKYSRKMNKKIKGITVDAMNLLVDYAFRGNVRELENEIEKAIALASEGEAIRADMLSDRIRDEFPLRELEEKVVQQGKSLKEILKGIERDIIARVLGECRGRVTLAARKLGLNRYSLYRKMEEFHIK